MISFISGGKTYNWCESNSFDWFYCDVVKNIEQNSVICIYNKLFYARRVDKAFAFYAPVDKDFSLKKEVQTDYFISDYNFNLDIRKQWFTQNILKG